MIQFIVKGANINKDNRFFSEEILTEKNGHYIASFDELSNEDRKELKQLFPQGFFRLGIWEQGGANFEDGEARLVCGEEGERLVPVVVRRTGFRANEHHALFIGTNLFAIELDYVKRDMNISINKYSIEPKIGILKKETLWSGKREELIDIPRELSVFSEAIEVGVRKVREYRCTEAFYYVKN